MSLVEQKTWSSKGEKWAPFNDVGGLISWVGRDDWVTEWREVSEPFHAILQVHSYDKGRSSLLFWFRDLTARGRLYPMFMSDYFNCFMAHKFDNTRLAGNFQVVKKGANYGIQLVNVPQWDHVLNVSIGYNFTR